MVLGPWSVLAAGSNGEVRACYYAAQGPAYITVEEGQRLIEDSNAIGRMIRRLQSTLKAPTAKA